MNNFYTTVIIILLFYIRLQSHQDTLITIWQLNNTDTVHGIKANYLIDKPKIISISSHKALYFDGIDDGFILDINPFKKCKNFTIEVIFLPDSSTNPNNYEQRFLHIQNENDSRRILLELRLIIKNLWTLDTFIKSINSRCTLLDTNNLHLTNK